MVSEGHIVGAGSICHAPKKREPNLASPLLEIGGGSEPSGALNDQVDTETRAHGAHERFIAIRFIRADPMVQMGRRNLQPQALTKIEQRASKRNRISAAGKPDQ